MTARTQPVVITIEGDRMVCPFGVVDSAPAVSGVDEEGRGIVNHEPGALMLFDGRHTEEWRRRGDVRNGCSVAGDLATIRTVARTYVYRLYLARWWDDPLRIDHFYLGAWPD